MQLDHVISQAIKAAWDEAEHPRHPAGSPEGGQFAPKGGSAAGEWAPVDDVEGRTDGYGVQPNSLEFTYPGRRDEEPAVGWRGKMKAAAQKRIAQAMAGDKEPDEFDLIAANRAMRTWADGSSDGGSEADAYQLLAYGELADKSAAAPTDGMDLAAKRARDNPLWMQRNERAYKQVRADTQAFFRSRGLGPDDEITVYRGMGHSGTTDKYFDGPKFNVRWRPLSSWSLSRKEADDFGHTTFSAKVRVRDIWAHFMSGVGCSPEQEVILNATGAYDVQVIRRTGKQRYR